MTEDSNANFVSVENLGFGRQSRVDLAILSSGKGETGYYAVRFSKDVFTKSPEFDLTKALYRLDENPRQHHILPMIAYEHVEAKGEKWITPIYAYMEQRNGFY